MNIVRSIFLLVLSFAALKVSISAPLVSFWPTAELIAFAAVVWGLAFLMMRNAKAEARVAKTWGFVAASLVTTMVLSALCLVVPIVKAVAA